MQARQFLIARRLIERGVRFVQLYHGDVQPWDSHDHIAENHRELARQCDQAIAALLTDLKQRGLFEETLVLCGGEFGRTPAVEMVRRQARPWAATTTTGASRVWLAGGGVKGGTIHGATDEFGYQAVENPVHVHDLHATILHLLGFDHTRLTYRYAGRDFRLTDVPATSCVISWLKAAAEFAAPSPCARTSFQRAANSRRPRCFSRCRLAIEFWTDPQPRARRRRIDVTAGRTA